MSLIAFLVSANLAVTAPALILEKVRAVDDPRGYDLRSDVQGDRAVPSSCSLGDKATVTLVRDADATLEVERDGIKKQVLIKDVRGLQRSTLACGDADRFYYVNPRHGQVYAYSADRLFRGDDPVVWSRRVAPFRSFDDANGVMADTSVATALLVRQHLVLVEWFYRKNGATGFWHQVFDAMTGSDLGKIGPSDLLAKTNDRDSWWILFQGGGNDTVNYVPQNFYRLRYGQPNTSARKAGEVLDALRAQPGAQHSKVASKLSPNPVVNHMIALLTPLRTASDARIEFCPQWPADRARYWLGQDYNENLGELARKILLFIWAADQANGTEGSPIDAWFHADIAPEEPMKTLLARFNPQDDQWIVHYQEALLALGGPTLERWFEEYGTSAGAFIPASKTKAP